MHKLINLRTTSVQTTYKISNVQYLSKFCVFCNFYHHNMPKLLTTFDHLQQRQHSSNTNSAMLISNVKLKKKRRLKKYAELLEVTDSSTNNRKASIKNLNADHFSRLVDKPDITLDKLHKIENKYYTKTKNDSKPLPNIIDPVNLMIIEHSENVENLMINQDSQNQENLIIDQYSKNPDYSAINQNSQNSEYSIIDKDSKNSIHPVIKQDFKNVVEQKTKVENISEIIALEDPLSSESVNHMKDINLPDDLDHENIMHKVDYAHNQSNINLKNIINFSSFEKFLNNNYRLKSKANGEDDIKNIEKQKTKQLMMDKMKLKQYNTLMLAYTNVCISCNDSNLFNQILTMCTKYTKKDLLHIYDINVFNMIIEKLSSDSNLESILQIFKFLRENSVYPTAQTYAYIFNCIGLMKCSDEEKLDHVNNIKSEMECDKITLNDIVTKSILVNDQKIVIEKIARLLDKNFQPNYEMPNLEYDCKLLNSLMDNCNIKSTVEGLSHLDLKKRLKKQMEMEMDGEVTIRSIAKQTASTQEIKFYKKKLSALEKAWENTVTVAFERNLDTLKNVEASKGHTRTCLYPYLCVLKPKDYVQVIMRKIRSLGLGPELYTSSYYSLCYSIGHQIFNMYELQLKQNYGVNDKTFDIYLKYSDWFVKRNDKLNCREKWMLLEHELNQYGSSTNWEIPNWSNNTLVSIGIFLFNIIFNEVKFNASSLNRMNNTKEKNLPAFFKLFRHKGMKLEAQVKTHPLIAKLYRDSNLENLSFTTTLVPSICPPCPWTGVKKGGYIITKCGVVRMSQSGNEQWDKLVQTDPKNLYPSLDSLNQLGSIPWAINTKILDLAIEIFQKDGSEKLNIPRPASVLGTGITNVVKNMSEEEKKKLIKNQSLLRIKKMEMHSLWCEALYRLSLANHFRNEIFWLPHNMDFRGRVYPIPPHLSHLAYDLGRSMLIFALKKPLGPKGLDWLKLHLINLTGFKKREPIEKRIEYANEILDQILDSAEKPLTGKMWWIESDSPWQTLATCMEIADALKSPNPEDFKSGFPIHQDGSCNGLQHYAALGRDKIGAESVNLSSCAVPKDVYNNVAIMIEELRVKDAAEGVEIAKLLEGCVLRKVIKQTVMTTVYGVTFYGAKLQIVRQLEDLNKLPQKHLWEGAIYLVNKTFLTLRSMFTSAREIQDWFTQCCGIICKTKNKSMEWVTPLGLPVVQPYSRQIQLQTKNISSNFVTKPNTGKQKNAFPPNFIHSLDSTHMMLTSVHSERAGITFVSVHDCFWTHPCTVEIMNKICREQFVSLHSEPILEDLAQFLMKTFVVDDNFEEEIIDEEPNHNSKKLTSSKKKLSQILLRVPKRGEFDLKEILSSTYFFS